MGVSNGRAESPADFRQPPATSQAAKLACVIRHASLPRLRARQRPGAMTGRSKRWFKSGAPRKKRVRAGFSSMTGARSAAPPARPDGFDNVDGGPERGVYIQMRGVEQVRIRRGFQRGRSPGGVALVPAQDVG